MKRIISVVTLAVAMIFGTLTVASPAQAESNYVCSNKNDQAGHTFSDDLRDVYVKAVVVYKFCVNAENRAFVKPFRVFNSYDVSGSVMDCGSFNRYLDGVRYNWYFKRPFDGSSFNPAPQTVSCDESTENSGTQVWELTEVPRFYFGPGTGEEYQPTWKVNVTLMRNMNTDKEWATTRDFNPSS